MIAHQGVCLVHRAEIMTMSGDWDVALEELRRCGEQFTPGALNQMALGDAASARVRCAGFGASSSSRKRPSVEPADSAGTHNPALH